MDVKVFGDESHRLSIFSVSGELDLKSKNELIERIPEIISNNAKALVADLSKLEYIDSAGIEAIFKLLKDANDRGLVVVFVKDKNNYVERKLNELGIMGIKGTKVVDNIDEAKKILGV